MNLNSVTLIGNLTKDIELKQTTTGKYFCGFTVAVKDVYQKDKTDFINCIAWEKRAEFLQRYAKKGDLLAIEGRISTRSYDGKNGKVYVTEIIANNVQLQSRERKETEPVVYDAPILDITNDDLPF